MKKFLIIPGVFVLLMGLGLLIRDFLAGPAVEASVTLSEYEVNMSTNRVAVNEPVRFVVTNTGQVTHTLVLERIGAIDKALGQGESGATASLKDIKPGETRTVIWTITSPGKYQLACHLPNHYEAGMVRSFTAGTVIDNNFQGSTGGLILIGMGTLLLAVTFLGAISITQQNRVFVYSQARAKPSK